MCFKSFIHQDNINILNVYKPYPVAEPEFFKWEGKLLTNTILCRHVLEINSKQIY
jgi:hypothetical protein